MERLKGKVAVITGGADGIGRATGRLFVDEGAKVLLVDIDEQGLKEGVAEFGDSASYVVADVSKEGPVNEYTKAAVDRYDRIDTVILNAGIEAPVKPLVEVTPEEFDNIIAINLRGVWLGIRAAVPEMAKTGGGTILLTSSVAGLRGYPLLGPYVTTKHALVGMARTAAIECADMNIRVNTVHPCAIETQMMRRLEQGVSDATDMDQKGAYAFFESTQALKRYGEPEEVAKLFLFLASDDALFLTGNGYVVDGGHTAGLIL